MADQAKLAIKIDPTSGVSGFKKLQIETDRFSSRLHKLGDDGANAFNKVKRAADLVLAPLKSMIAVYGSLKAATLALGGASLGAAGDYEMFQRQLETVTASAREAKRAFKESMDFSVATPFSPSEIIRTRVALEAIGVKGLEAVKSVASASAAMNRDINDVAAAVMSMETEPLRRLGIRLAKNEEDFLFRFKDTMGRAQQISVVGLENAQQALLGIFSDKYASGLGAMSKTYQGLKSTLSGEITDLRATFAEGFLDEAKLFVGDLIRGSAAMKEAAKVAGTELGDKLGDFRVNMLAGFDMAMVMVDDIKKAFELGRGGEVIIEALSRGANILGVGFLEAIKVSLSVWKAIGFTIGGAILEVMYNSGLPGLSNIGAQKKRSDFDSIFSDLSDKQVYAALSQRWVGLEGLAEIPRGMKDSGNGMPDRGDMLNRMWQWASTDTDEQLRERLKTWSSFADKELVLVQDKYVNELLISMPDKFKQAFGDIQAVAVNEFSEWSKTLASASGQEGKDYGGLYDTNSATRRQEEDARRYAQRTGGYQDLYTEPEATKGYDWDLKGDFSYVKEIVDYVSKADLTGMREIISSLKDEREMIGLSDSERAKYVAGLKIEEAARKGGISITDRAILGYKKEAEEIIDAIESVRKAKEDDKRKDDAIGSMGKAEDRLTAEERILKHNFSDARERAAAMVDYEEDAKIAFGEKTADYDAAIADYNDRLDRIVARKDLIQFADSIGDSFGNAFTDVIMGAKSAQEAIDALAKDIARLVVQQAVALPIANAVSAGIVAMYPTAPATPSYMGNIFADGGIKAFALGGVVSSPSYFNVGSMSEAGPEAIMPLGRDKSGRLGVYGGSGGTQVVNEINVINNSSTPVSASVGGQTWDGKKFVTSIVLEDLNNGGQISKTLKGMNNAR